MAPYDPFTEAICICGQPSVLRMYVHYKYPRSEFLPQAMDPWYVHGGGYRFTTCGAAGCEADAFLACREEIINDHLFRCAWVPLQEAAEQMAGLELEVTLEPGGGIWVAGDEEADA